MGPAVGVPIIRIIVYWDLFGVPPFFWKLPHLHDSNQLGLWHGFRPVKEGSLDGPDLRQGFCGSTFLGSDLDMT